MEIITAATSEPVSLAEAKTQCRIDSDITEFDSMIETVWIPAAREFCEASLGMILAPTLVRDTSDSFPGDSTRTTSSGVSTTEPGTLALEGSPVLAIQSITYIDEDGIEQTLDNTTYALDNTQQISVVRLNSGETWPATDSVANAVKVNYTVGYSAAGDSPQDKPMKGSIKAAMLMLVAHFYRNPEATVEKALTEVPMGVCWLLRPIQLRSGFA